MANSSLKMGCLIWVMNLEDANKFRSIDQVKALLELCIKKAFENTYLIQIDNWKIDEVFGYKDWSGICNLGKDSEISLPCITIDVPHDLLNQSALCEEVLTQLYVVLDAYITGQLEIGIYK